MAAMGLSGRRELGLSGRRTQKQGCFGLHSEQVHDRGLMGGQPPKLMMVMPLAVAGMGLSGPALLQH
jgi:hypothetical protein